MCIYGTNGHVVLSADKARVLGLLEEFCTKLRKPEEQQLRTAILRVMGIFKSNLFEALLGKSVKLVKINNVVVFRFPKFWKR